MTNNIRNEPFKHHGISKGVTDPQVTYAEFNNNLQNIDDDSLIMYVRAYIQERTPAAFASNPMLWEAIREWFAKRLTVHPREIGLSGSAQSGFSLNKSKQGNPFNPKSSDLDFFVVSQCYLSRIDNEIKKFMTRYTDNSSKYKDQALTVERHLNKGYIDLIQIPADHVNYPKISTALNDVSIIIDRLKLHDFKLSRSHLRVYKDWKSLGQWVKRTYSASNRA